MGLLDTLLGRSKASRPHLDELFALPSAAVTLDAALDLKPTGVGSICFKSAEGRGFSGLREQVATLLAVDGDKYEETTDNLGFDWIVRRGDPNDLTDLVADLHAFNSSLIDAGFGGALLCTLVTFTSGDAPPVALIYLFGRGTFYPFAPTGGHRRDNSRELQIQAALGDDLRVESDVSRWFPVWGAPGL